MTTEQQRKMLECAAKAMGWIDFPDDSIEKGEYWHLEADKAPFGRRMSKLNWNPLTNPADTASMCAKLNINYTWMCGYVECWKWDGPSIKSEHDDTDAGKESAWRLAASMVAAKIGGMK